MTRKNDAERQEATDRLREWIKPGDTIYTIVRHVSRSGMQRTVDTLGIESGSNPARIWAYGWNVAKALGWKFDRDRDGVKVSGCGMDMGFHLVYAMSSAMYPDGFGCIGEGCPSNDHSNGDRDYTPYKHRDIPHVAQLRGEIPPVTSPDHWHADGGYALRQRWL